MKNLLCLVLVLLAVLEAPAPVAGERWWGASAGSDISNFDPMLLATVQMGEWRDDGKVGYRVLAEYADPFCDNTLWTADGQVLRKWRSFYIGGGMALSNRRLCGKAGTKWNFSLGMGAILSKNLSLSWRHRSHASDFGFAPNSPNKGVNIFELVWHTSWN